MVNTSDFRRYSYEGDAAYALEAFNRTRSSAAPQAQPPKRRRLTVSPNTEMKSKKQLLKEQKKAFAQVVQILTVTVLALSMLFGVLFTYVQKNELTKSIANIRDEISVAQSENVSLNAQLEALVSVSQIDSYAVEKLGMTRLQSNQIKYIDTAQYRQNNAAAAAVEQE